MVLSDGPTELTSFNAAHPKIKARFLAALAAHAAREHQSSREIFALHGVWPRGYSSDLPQWSEIWKRRSQWTYDTEQDPGLLDAQRRRDTEWYRLHDIPPAEYIEELAQVQFDGRGKCRCPLHEERTASFSVNAKGWHCFGCAAGGKIYEFAGALWGLDTKGEDFNAIHRRLVGVFLGGE